MGAVVLGAAAGTTTGVRKGGLPVASTRGPKVGTRRDVAATVAGAGRRCIDACRVGILLLVPTREATQQTGTSVARVGTVASQPRSGLRQVVPPVPKGAQGLARAVARRPIAGAPVVAGSIAIIGRLASLGPAASRVVDAARDETTATQEATPRCVEVVSAMAAPIPPVDYRF